VAHSVALVESHSAEKPFYLLVPQPGNEAKGLYRTAVQQLDLHPEFDLAVGVARLHAPLQPWPVGVRQLVRGEPFVTFGYPSTETLEFQNGRFRALAMNYHPTAVGGFIDAYQDGEPQLGPVYVHRTRLAGGISGGPLAALDGHVYALNSRGYDPDCELALALAPLLAWRVGFLGGMTLGEFIAEHERSTVTDAPHGR
jgi:hypothetical protein